MDLSILRKLEIINKRFMIAKNNPKTENRHNITLESLEFIL